MNFFTTILAILLQTAKMQIEESSLTVEIAKTSSEKEKGLMGRSHLRDDQGMLFVYEKSSHLTFWMKNTYIPLSIGFFNQSKELIAIQDMDPPKNAKEPLILYSSPAPAQYALEVPQGWFEKHKIKPGARFSLHDH